MIPQTLGGIARDVGGELRGPDGLVSSVETDSRRVRPGSLFFALRGVRSDGRLFAGEAARRGSAGVVLTDPPVDGVPCIVVGDAGDALLALATAERGRLLATVAAITGSVGKTTAKDMASAVLGARFRVHASPRSFNNQVGLPLTVLGAGADTDVLVCEIGAGVPGEIAELCRVARPRIGVVTAVGAAHLETFGSVAAIARAKGEMVEALPPDGIAILNADDRIVAGFRRRTKAQVVSFGRHRLVDVRAEGVSLDEQARAGFVLSFDGRSAFVRLPVPGEHMVTPALAAAALGRALGLGVDECARGLQRARTSPGRMRLLAAGSLRLLDDSYNANPASTAAALRAARAATGAGRFVAVLGEMAELGAASRQEHERIGRLVAKVRVAQLITVGKEARWIVAGAIEKGLPATVVYSAMDTEEALDSLLTRLRPGDLVLIKGSRSVGLERLVAGLRARAKPGRDEVAPLWRSTRHH